MTDGTNPDRTDLPLEVLDRIDRICDRFEAAWDRGERPHVEDALGQVEAPHRRALLRDLLAAEIAARTRRGERPEPREYRDRFPDHPAAVDAAFAAAPRRPDPAAASPEAQASLFVGLLGFQTGLIDQSALVESLRDWIGDKSRPLAEVLAARGAIDGARRALLEALAAECLRQHGGDVARSLASLPAGASTRERLAGLADTDLDATISRVGAGPTEPGAADFHLAAGYAIGTAGDGQRFRVLRPHAQGGLGAVFVALDTELHREVALKQILERHADDRVSRSRFLAEAEITGNLEHPGIVPVYGLGTYGDGRPYYAMRFVEGEGLKEAIEHFHQDEALKQDPGRRSLELRRLLRRFTDVCNAIEYAHSRGVLHRDIKPGNIIVGRHGETLVVDWGLAKVVGRDGAGAAACERPLIPQTSSGLVETLPGSALGTPAYMSPEQAGGELDRLGPRSDVYSLGATLYCLLVGRPPFENDVVGELIRAVRDGRYSPPRAIEPSIDPALEAICKKAMSLRPEDRYESARAVADDLERWMADEPVTAWREPMSRRARRWAKRHRTSMTATVVALVAGVIGLGAVAGVQAQANNRLRGANAATNQALAETREAQAQTKAALGQSEESRQQAQAVSDFLVQAFRSPDPYRDSRTIKVVDVLERAAERLEREFAGSQATRGALLNALGKTYWGLGLYDRSISLLTKARAVREAALGPDHLDTLTSCNDLARAYSSAGRLPEAVALHQATLKLQEARLGPDHPDTLTSCNNLATAYAQTGLLPEAIALHQATLKLQESKLGPDHPDTLHSRNNLGIYYWLTGRTSEAIAWHTETLKRRQAALGPDHPDTLKSRHNLAIAYLSAGRLPEAIAMHEGTLKLCEAKLGPDHPQTLSSLYNLTVAYLDDGRAAEAIPLIHAALEGLQAKLGRDHVETLSSLHNLADAYRDVGRMSEAIALNQEVLERKQAKLGRDHPDTLSSRDSLARAYRDVGRMSGAIALHEAALERRQATLGPDHPDTLHSRGGLAQAYGSMGRWTEAEHLRRDVLARRRRTDKPDSLNLAGDLAALGHDLLEQARWSEAEPLLREALAIREKANPDTWRRYEAMSLLGGALLGQGRYAEAEPLIVPGYEGMKARESRITMPEKPLLREAAERVVGLYEAWGKPEEAATWKTALRMPDLPADVFARP